MRSGEPVGEPGFVDDPTVKFLFGEHAGLADPDDLARLKLWPEPARVHRAFQLLSLAVTQLWAEHGPPGGVQFGFKDNERFDAHARSLDEPGFYDVVFSLGLFERSIALFRIRGILYHLRRVYQEYRGFVSEVSGRAGDGASVLIIYAPSFQRMLFEFYALVNLCRISLDNLRLYLAPLFKKGSQHLPKSVRDVLKGSIDCPVYRFLNDQPVLHYLIDLRNCLVHYRSFATSDNAFVIEEGTDAKDIAGDSEYFAAMARADFRRVGENAISVNVHLPDRIFETAAGGKLAKFTYEERWSLLSTAKSFSELAITALTERLRCLEAIKEPRFTFSSGKKAKNSQ